MIPLEDELDRLFSDERLDLRPGAGSADTIVRGARRRRTRRIAASAAGSVAVIAAATVLALGAVDLGPAADRLSPAVPPATTDAQPNETSAPSPTPTEGPAPDPTDPPTDLTPDPTDPPTGGDAGLPVLDPGAGFGGVRLGMTIAELEQIPGMRISEYPDGAGRNEYCYGRYETDEVAGTISVARGNGAPEPARSDDDYLVTTLSLRGPFETPEGIGVGATIDDVRRAYPGVEVAPNFSRVEVPGFTITSPAGPSQVAWIFGGVYENGTGTGDVVEGMSLDAGQTCAG